MMPERITDEVYNALRWERKEVTDLDSEMQGYTVLVFPFTERISRTARQWTLVISIWARLEKM